MNANSLLILYSAVLTAAGALAIGSGAIANDKVTRFAEIDVQRINVREADGTLRMIISNTDKSPGIYMHNKERPHPSGNRGAGIIFLNEEGSENGGLTFSGKKEDGKARSGGHLSFDQYEQDQVIQLTQNENNGRRWAAMIVSDRPDTPLDFDLAQKISAMPAGPERDAAIKKIQEEGTFGRQRLYVGKTRDKESAVMLNDGMGRPRILMRVTADGAAKIEFMDEKGGVVRSITPQG